MNEPRSITISVGYGGLLAVTLPRNMKHLRECLVVTSPDDERTREVASSVDGVRVLVTDAFTRHGARFNKGLAMEEALDALGREGWILIWDADIVFPDSIPWSQSHPEKLNGARRRLLVDPSEFRDGMDWGQCLKSADDGPIGFFQLFRADCEALEGVRPWYDVSFAHAGGGDAWFMRLWPRSHWNVMDFECLHLGPKDTNWFGTDAEGRDIMSAYVHRRHWRRAMQWHDPSAQQRVGEIVERVEVPGYPRSRFDISNARVVEATGPVTRVGRGRRG